jgi:nuclear transcription factor Y gamma
VHDFASSKHQLPLARIKKIMKSDEDVRMISAEAPVLFAKACELFVLDLTLRAWAYPDHGAQAEGQVPASHSSSPPPKRRTLQRNDIACAIQHAELFDFLHEIMPVLPHNPEEEGTPPHVRITHPSRHTESAVLLPDGPLIL